MKRWDCIARRFRKAKGRIAGAEVGVWKGTMSYNLLRMIPTLTLYMIDRWTSYSKEEQERDGISEQRLYEDKVFKAAMKQALKRAQPFGKRAVPMVMESRQACESFEDNSLDFVFVDGDHSYEGVKEDIDIWLPKIKTGGYICGHDYDSRPGVRQAVDEAFGTAVKADANRTWFYKVVR